MNGRWIIFVCLSCALFGCAKAPSKPSEAQFQANALVQATFLGNAEYWFAAEKVGGGSKSRLVEFHKPRSSLMAQPLTEADRMNGVSERFSLALNYGQIRWWDGHWSEWKEGTGAGAADFVNALVGGKLGYWSVVFEKKNDEWHVQSGNPNAGIQSDKALLESLMKEAGVRD